MQLHKVHKPSEERYYLILVSIGESIGSKSKTQVVNQVVEEKIKIHNEYTSSIMLDV